MRKMIATGLATLILMMLSGCGAIVPKEHDPGVKLDTKQYQDITVPEGFTLVERDTWSYYRPFVRVGQFHYFSQGESPYAFSFINGKLSELGWTLSDTPPQLDWQVAGYRRDLDRLLLKVRKLRDDRVEIWILVNLEVENPKEPG